MTNMSDQDQRLIEEVTRQNLHLKMIADRLGNIEDARAKPSVWSRSFKIAEKLVIPIVISIIAYVAAIQANKIVERQSKASLQQKYIEIFWDDITSGEPRRQQWANSVLKLLEPELANALVSAVEQNQEIDKGALAQLVIDGILKSVELLPPGEAWSILRAPPAEIDDFVRSTIAARLGGNAIEQSAVSLQGPANDDNAKAILKMLLVLMSDRSPENIMKWKADIQSRLH